MPEFFISGGTCGNGTGESGVQFMTSENGLRFKRT